VHRRILWVVNAALFIWQVKNVTDNPYIVALQAGHSCCWLA
jgi:hypothetical protein